MFDLILGRFRSCFSKGDNDICIRVGQQMICRSINSVFLAILFLAMNKYITQMTFKIEPLIETWVQIVLCRRECSTNIKRMYCIKTWNAKRMKYSKKTHIYTAAFLSQKNSAQHLFYIHKYSCSLGYQHLISKIIQSVYLATEEGFALNVKRWQIKCVDKQAKIRIKIKI